MNRLYIADTAINYIPLAFKTLDLINSRGVIFSAMAMYEKPFFYFNACHYLVILSVQRFNAVCFEGSSSFGTVHKVCHGLGKGRSGICDCVTGDGVKDSMVSCEVILARNEWQ